MPPVTSLGRNGDRRRLAGNGRATSAAGHVFNCSLVLNFFTLAYPKEWTRVDFWGASEGATSARATDDLIPIRSEDQKRGSEARNNVEEPIRCGWAGNELAMRYHDEEWGVPLHDDRAIFEFIVLEGAQAGLSWDTILRKRERYREVFDHFDHETVARYDEAKVAQLLADPGIIRNKMKINAAIQNARAFLAVRDVFGTFDAYIWRFVDGQPIVNSWRTLAEIPARTAESDALSADLRKRGFSFVGSTICYAHMQATGMVNDHLVDCFRYAEVRGA